MSITSRIEKTVLVAMKGDGKGFLDSFKANAIGLTKMNGTTDMMGMPSQGAQELAQKVDQNEKTGVMQKIAGFLQNQNPYNDIMEDNSVVDPQTGRSINKSLLEMLNNRPDLRQRFNETGTIYSE